MNPSVAETREVISQTIINTHEKRVALFQQAIEDDLAGLHRDARDIYDALKNSELADAIAVPSAVNQAALEQFKAARQEFDELAKSSNIRDRDYARLWQLWLTARQGNAAPQKLTQTLKEMAADMNMAATYQQEIINLYIGKGSVEAVFDAVHAMPITNDLQRKDALTEATFFTSGYLRYVRNDKAAAKDLLQKKNRLLNAVSLEMPLITREKAAL